MLIGSHAGLKHCLYLQKGIQVDAQCKWGSPFVIIPFQTLMNIDKKQRVI